MPRISKKSGTYHHGDLRRVLLETAARVIEQEGLSALSLQAIAKRAGVSSGAPYHHFESREELLKAIAEQGFELLVAEMKRAAEEAGPGALAYLRGIGFGYVRFAVAHPGHFRVMFRVELHTHVANGANAKEGEGFEMLRTAILRCQQEGLAPSGDPMPLILCAWSCVHGASALWIDGSLGHQSLLDAEQLAATVSSTIVQLIAGSARDDNVR